MQIEDLDDVRVFVQVVQSRSFTGAARQLGLPKSTVSRRIAQLEQQLGVRLLHRTTRTLHLTDVGELYYARAERVITELEAAERDVLAMQAVPRGRLRITAPADLRYLARLITGFQERHPEVEVFASLTQRTVDLVGEGFDLGLRAGRLSDSSLVAKKLADLRSGLFASPTYLARKGTPQSLSELSEHACALFSRRDTRGEFRLLDERGHSVTVPVTAAIAGDDFGFLRDAALCHAGIALLPFFLGAPEVDAGTLQRVLPSYEGRRSALNAVYPSPEHLTPKVRAFIDHARAALQEGVDGQA